MPTVPQGENVTFVSESPVFHTYPNPKSKTPEDTQTASILAPDATYRHKQCIRRDTLMPNDDEPTLASGDAFSLASAGRVQKLLM